jgi:hypothetical protein
MIGRTLFVLGCLSAATLAAPARVSAQLPDSRKSPGDTATSKREQVCASDFAASIKPVPGWASNRALAGYGIRPETFSSELDHVVPLVLGGSNSPDNLYPFHPNGAFTLVAKQTLAAKLRDLVCAGNMSLKEAQNAFRKDWTKEYQRLMNVQIAANGK